MMIAVKISEILKVNPSEGRGIPFLLGWGICTAILFAITRKVQMYAAAEDKIQMVQEDLSKVREGTGKSIEFFKRYCKVLFK